MKSMFLRQLHEGATRFSKRRTMMMHAANAPRPFEAIPGPPPLPIVGNIWRYLPVIGEFDPSRVDRTAEILMKRYGTLVREKIIAGNTVLHVFDPRDMQIVFAYEGRNPLRRSHRALMKYRMERKELYSSGGLFPTVGAEWARLRKAFQKALLGNKSVTEVIGGIDEITNDLIDRIRMRRNSENEVDDFLQDLFRWALEGAALFTLNIRLGGLPLTPNKDVEELIVAADRTNEAVMLTENASDLWKWYPTKAYRQLSTSQDTMARIVRRYLDQALSDKHNQGTVLKLFLEASGVDEKDIYTVIMDLILAGIDTTSIASGFSLYHLARNPRVQQRLREEVIHFLPEKTSPIEESMFNDMKYLRACVKENMRLTPVSLGIGRVLPEDIILQNYHIPAGTKIVTHNQVSSRQPEYFPDPLTMRPERWLRNTPDYSKAHPLLVLPFGIGPRSCIGRRFAEREIYVVLAKIIRNFHVDYKYDDIGILTHLINTPDKPLRFSFTDVEE